jgi:hypothetical protein
MVMAEIKLLIIEDEEAQLQAYNDAIDSFNKKTATQIIRTICKTFTEGEQALLSPFYDAAIIDLKLSQSEELEGKKLVEKVYQKIRIPIFIVSGSLSQIDDIEENVLFRKRLRTELISGVLKEILEIFNTGITSFLRPAGIIDEKLSEIFWGNLAADLDIWINQNNPNALLRYILSHFQEHLDVNIDGYFEEYHPSEVYIKPPIRKKLHTGDFIRYQNEYYVILNPACDIVVQGDPEKGGKRNADTLTLVKARSFEYNTLCLNKNNVLDKNKIEGFVKNKNNRYHFLPPFGSNTGFLIDFQDITSIPFTEELERVASVSNPFIKDIIARFSNYYARQGQPTFNQDVIVQSFLK